MVQTTTLARAMSIVYTVLGTWYLVSCCDLGHAYPVLLLLLLLLLVFSVPVIIASSLCLLHTVQVGMTSRKAEKWQ